MSRRKIIGGRTGKPPEDSLPAPYVKSFRALLAAALDDTDARGRRIGDAKWGVYAFYDYEGEPIYVGQTNERLRVRIRRHLTNQRTDAQAMGVLDIFEVAELEMWPLWEFESRARSDGEARALLDACEFTVYSQAIRDSRYHAILNEKLPPKSKLVVLPTTNRRCALITDEMRFDRGHPDIRIERRAMAISRLAQRIHERGAVSVGLRRALVIQAIRLTHLASVRLAEAEGRAAPGADIIPSRELAGSLFIEVPEEGEESS